MAFCSASLSMLFQILMKPEMILHKWINVLCWLYNNNYKSISKILGLCYLCNSFWIMIIICEICINPINLFNNISIVLITTSFWFLFIKLFEYWFDCIYHIPNHKLKR